MNPFPEEWELLSLFEVEPSFTDRDVPKFYNEWTFDTVRGDDRVLCSIDPGYEILRITWWHRGDVKIALDLNWVKGIRVVTGGGCDCLVASFQDSNLLDLEFHLRPTIRLNWGTSDECP